MNKWPVFSEKDLIIGNLSSKIGVCTLWSPRNKFVNNHIGDLINKIAVVGNLYSIFGIGILIRNYLTNPNLRYLIITGTEIGKAKSVIKNLENSNLPQRLFLDKSQIEKFQRQVRIFYVNTKDVRSFIKGGEYRDLVLESKNFKPILVPLPEPDTNIFPGPDSGYLIRVRDIAEGYIHLLREIKLFGHITEKDSEGHRRQELWLLTVVITAQDPVGFASIPHPEYSARQIQRYCEDFWTGVEPKDLAYRYGHIIRNEFGDQVRVVIEAFKDKKETFRTVISLWNPDVDRGSIKAEDPPCLITIHPRIIGDYLHQYAYIRTNEMFAGWPLNAIALRYFQYRLLEKLKLELNRPEIKLGDLTITSASAHIYDTSWLTIDDFLRDRKTNNVKTKFLPDPKGNFEIRVSKNEIVVRHFSLEGELLQTFSGKKAEWLGAQIAPFMTQVKNALYVGRELQRAESKLRSSLAKGDKKEV